MYFLIFLINGPSLLNSVSRIVGGGSPTESGFINVAGSILVDPASAIQPLSLNTSSTVTFRFPLTVVGFTVCGSMFFGKNFSFEPS